LIAIAGIFAFSGQIPFLSPASPTPSPSLAPVSPTLLPTTTPVPPSTFTPVPTPTIPITPTAVPMPGGSDQIAILSGNQIYTMNMDGTDLIQVRTDNSPKSNLQWVSGNRLLYTARNCIYLINGATKANQQIACFGLDQALEGFRVSPDERFVAVSIEKTLNIVPFDLNLFKGVTSRFHLLALR